MKDTIIRGRHSETSGQTRAVRRYWVAGMAWPFYSPQDGTNDHEALLYTCHCLWCPLKEATHNFLITAVWSISRHHVKRCPGPASLPVVDTPSSLCSKDRTSGAGTVSQWRQVSSMGLQATQSFCGSSVAQVLLIALISAAHRLTLFP